MPSLLAERFVVAPGAAWEQNRAKAGRTAGLRLRKEPGLRPPAWKDSLPRSSLRRDSQDSLPGLHSSWQAKLEPSRMSGRRKPARKELPGVNIEPARRPRRSEEARPRDSAPLPELLWLRVREPRREPPPRRCSAKQPRELARLHQNSKLSSQPFDVHPSQNAREWKKRRGRKQERLQKLPFLPRQAVPQPDAAPPPPALRFRSSFHQKLLMTLVLRGRVFHCWKRQSGSARGLICRNFVLEGQSWKAGWNLQTRQLQPGLTGLRQKQRRRLQPDRGGAEWLLRQAFGERRARL